MKYTKNSLLRIERNHVHGRLCGNKARICNYEDCRNEQLHPSYLDVTNSFCNSRLYIEDKCNKRKEIVAISTMKY